MSRASTAKPAVPLFDPTRDREALLNAGNRLLLEGLGVENALEFLRLLGGGRDRFDDLRRQWGHLSVDGAFEEFRRVSIQPSSSAIKEVILAGPVSDRSTLHHLGELSANSRRGRVEVDTVREPESIDGDGWRCAP